jgi:hypothetical protein
MKDILEKIDSTLNKTIKNGKRINIEEQADFKKMAELRENLDNALSNLTNYFEKEGQGGTVSAAIAGALKTTVSPSTLKLIIKKL